MTVPELLERDDRGRDEGVVADRLGRCTLDVDGLLVEDEEEVEEVWERGRDLASESGVEGVVGVEGGVTFWRERQWKREKKVGVEGEETGVVGVEREGEAGHQPQRLEQILGQVPGEPARDLVAELVHAGVDDRLVVAVVAVH